MAGYVGWIAMVVLHAPLHYDKLQLNDFNDMQMLRMFDALASIHESVDSVPSPAVSGGTINDT